MKLPKKLKGLKTTLVPYPQAPFELGAEKSHVVIHIFLASHEKRPAVMHRLWRNGQWAHAITAYGLPPCLFNEQRVGVDFEHQPQLALRQFLIRRIEKNAALEQGSMRVCHQRAYIARRVLC